MIVAGGLAKIVVGNLAQDVERGKALEGKLEAGSGGPGFWSPTFLLSLRL